MKRKSNIQLLEWMNEMMEILPSIVFKYRFEEKTNTHYISVSPESIMDDEYCEKENNVFDSLSQDFPNENFVFGVENKNFIITNDFKTITKDFIRELLNSFNVKELKVNVDYEYNVEIQISLSAPSTSKNADMFNVRYFGINKTGLRCITN